MDMSPDGKYLATFQFINPSMVKNGGSGQQEQSSGGGGQGPAVWVTEGKSLTPAGGGFVISFQSTRFSYFTHMKAIIIGKEAARHSIRKAFDLHARFPQERLTQLILIAKGTANEVLKASTPLEKIPGLSMEPLVNSTVSMTSEVIPVRSIDLFKALISKTRAPVITQVEVVSNDNGEKLLRLSGSAVIRKDRWVAELDGRETRGLAWVLNKVKRTVYELREQSGEVFVAIEILNATSKIRTEIRNGQVIINIDVKAEANIIDLLVAEDWSTPEKMRQLGQMTSNMIRREIMATWRKARHLNADIYGFGEAVRRKHPRAWKKMEPEWERIFPQIRLRVKVETNVVSAGELIKPPLPQ